MSKISALYPGTFDALTYGHLDVIKRASKIFDRLIIGVAQNIDKSPIFSVDERIEMLREVTKDMDNVTVEKFEGLTIDYAQKIGARVIIRGLRAVSDYEFELQLAMMNRTLNADIEALFFTPSTHYSFLSSKLVKEIAYFGGDISGFVPPIVAERIKEKIEQLNLRK